MMGASADTADETEAVAPLALPGDTGAAEPDARMSAENGAPGFDPAAESAYLADARERGEVVTEPATAAIIEAEDADEPPLPRLDELVKRIPPDVRTTLDDLFRAHFVTVKRFPKTALKL